jgi:hypothetical protein
MPTVRLVNPSRSKSRRSSRKSKTRRRRSRGMNKATRAAVSEMLSRKISASGGTMKRRKKNSTARRRSRRRASNPSRRRKRIAFQLAPRRVRRRRNPGLEGIGGNGLIPMIGGAAAGFFGARIIANVGPLASYNTGFAGYGLTALAGLGISYLAARFVDKQAATGVLVGTGLAVAARVYEDHMAPTATGGVSGDLAYYVSERFPFPQDNGGPYGLLPGNPYLQNPPFPSTSAAAVRAGAAAAAALPATAAPATGQDAAQRWGSTRWQ